MSETEDYSQIQLKEEKIKRICAKDPVYYINNFVKTFDPRLSPPVIPFKLWEFQEDYIKLRHHSLINKYDLLVDKSRDMGATWLEVAFASWCFLFYPGFQGLWGGKKEDDVDDKTPSTLFGKMDIVLNNLPKFLLPKGFDSNKHRHYLKLINPENGNTIIGESANQQFSRSGRYTSIFMDEFAFWDYGEKAWIASGDSSPNRVLMSTPNGKGNIFADIRFGGKIKRSEMHWRLHPDKGKDAYFDEVENKWRSPWYDKEVERRMHAGDSSLKNILQELDVSYIQSGDPVYNARYLKRHELKIQHPNKYESYAIGADVSAGEEGVDYSSFDVVAKTTGEQVFSWEGKVSIDQFVRLLIDYGFLFNEAIIGVENNNAGVAVINELKKRYKRLYMQKKYDSRTNAMTQTVGWNTNVKTKSKMILDLQAALYNEEILLTHKRTIDELMIYEIKDSTTNITKYGAPKGKHDDKVMSLAIAWQVLQDVKMPLTPKELRLKKEKKKKLKTSKKFVSGVCGY